MPRPRKSRDTQLSRQVIFRLPESEYAELEALAKRAGLRGVNDLARQLTRRGKGRVVIQTTKRHDPAFIAQIRSIGVNLNQLTRKAHIRDKLSPVVNDLFREIHRMVMSAANDVEAA